LRENGLVRELVGRLAALDPDASAAVQVIAYFAGLAEARAGLGAIVRGAAVLAGCPAGLSDEDRHVRIRMLPDGTREDGGAPLDPNWPSAPVGSGPFWLENPGPTAGAITAMVQERAAAAARDVLDRTRGRAPSSTPGDDPALVELVLDGSVPEPERLRAARRLGLRDGIPARAVAVEAGASIESGTEQSRSERTGIGTSGLIADLPASWAAARIALRMAAEGTEADPGPRVVHADALGGLAVLAQAVGPDTEPVPDVKALERAAATAPWMLSTLHAAAFAQSLRTAAATLTVHHSTLQDRLTRGEHLLGWSVHDPQGRLRLQLAFALRRLHRNPG
jgi:hypothetical protein